jgi:GT2 family glycosyltransferase
VDDLSLVSVVIVTWNSAAHLPACLQALAAQAYSDFEVVLVDNGSTDGCVDAVEDRWPGLQFHVVRLGENKGFAAANNLGARSAHGQWLALLNADAFPEPHWLEELVKAAENNLGYSFFASRQVMAEDSSILDGAGDVYHVSGLAWRRYHGLPAGKYGMKTEEVFSPCGAAALYLRQMFVQAGGFDEDFFSYFEDVDLGFRLHLLGFKCLYVPGAVVEHVGSASTGKRSDFAIYHGHRNLIWSYVKNMPALLLWFFLPLHLLMGLYFLISFSASGHGKAIWRAKVDGLRGLGHMLAKRRKIQRLRWAPVRDIYHLMESDWFAPLKFMAQRNRVSGGR